MRPVTDAFADISPVLLIHRKNNSADSAQAGLLSQVHRSLPPSRSRNGIPTENSLSQWRDRTGFTPVSLFIPFYRKLVALVIEIKYLFIVKRQAKNVKSRTNFTALYSPKRGDRSAQDRTVPSKNPYRSTIFRSHAPSASGWPSVTGSELKSSTPSAPRYVTVCASPE